MNEIIKKIGKLIDTKSLITLALTIVFCILSLRSIISGQEFLTVFNIVIAFYFGTQYEKNKSKVETSISNTDDK